MKRIFTLLFLLNVLLSHGQVLSVNNLVTAVSLTSGKADNFISHKGFSLVNTNSITDTAFQTYSYQSKKKKNKDKDSTVRSFSKYVAGATAGVIYETSSLQEFEEIKQQLKDGSFICNADNDSSVTTWFFQKQNLSAIATIAANKDDTRSYTIKLQKVELPEIREVIYAEDLLSFTSHEYLAYNFGKNNVKKDIYFFSEKEFNRCSVLFPNSPRQAVFIWGDEKNDCGLKYIIFGGQLMVQSAIKYDQIVGENNWTFKSNIHAGMPLTELRRFNGQNFSFYSGRSEYSGMVMPATTGKINFKKESVVLACLNCDDNKFFAKSTMSADEAINEGRRFFILSIMLFPDDPPKSNF